MALGELDENEQKELQELILAIKKQQSAGLKIQ